MTFDEREIDLSDFIEKPAGERIDRFLSGEYEDLTRSRIQKLIEKEAILVDHKPVKSNYKLKGTELLNLRIPSPEEVDIVPEDIPLSIVYEDNDLLVVDKPRGMVVHPANGHLSGTLVNALIYHCKDDLSGINGEKRPGIVHRIDKDTSGLLVVCKSDAAHQGLSAQLKEHTVTRRYFSVVKGVITEDGTIDAPIGRSSTDRKKMTVNPKGRSRRAVTHFKVVEMFSKHTFVECRLETGRTHQIRVHMASINHPVTGDLIYGRKDTAFPHVEGQVLHAGILGFIHPVTGKYLEFSSPLPLYFTEVLDQLRKTERLAN